MNRQEAVNWLLSEEGGRLDFDGQYGNQCVDYFNYYYQFLTGRSPYSDGYGVPGAKDLWNVGTDLFTKIPNDFNDANQVPSPGDIIIYNSNWGGGWGHVEMCLSADSNGYTVSAQNTQGQYVSQDWRSWNSVASGIIGWLSFNGFVENAPVVVPPVVETPAPTPYIPPVVDIPVETPVEAPVKPVEVTTDVPSVTITVTEPVKPTTQGEVKVDKTFKSEAKSFLLSLMSRKFVAMVTLAVPLFLNKNYTEAIVVVLGYFGANVAEKTL